MNYSQRHLELNARFKLGIDTHLDESNIDIRFFPFRSMQHTADGENISSNQSDDSIDENLSFEYPVFFPNGMQKMNKAILLLHGLNERNWSKYLTWAEYLCQETGKPVILFPIAFHMNRSPLTWCDPRSMGPVMDLRRKRNGKDRSLSFANVAFSERISENPLRFYKSGRQSVYDLAQLFENIKTGDHPLFEENTQIDIFAYSIGAFLAEITLMTNPKKLFSDSKLFIFCGGGIFRSMAGESRTIMDKRAFESLFNYYLNDFATDIKLESTRDKVFETFYSMISPERNQQERELFFKELGNRVKGISLVRDKVMPYVGVVEALGVDYAESHVAQLDFPFPYTHENPFPVSPESEKTIIDGAFTTIFSQAAQFLA